MTQVAVTCVSGVVSARVVVALGPRPVAMVGALLASAGLLSARWVPPMSKANIKCHSYQYQMVQPILLSFARDLAGILVTYSLLAGLGFGLM